MFLLNHAAFRRLLISPSSINVSRSLASHYRLPNKSQESSTIFDDASAEDPSAEDHCSDQFGSLAPQPSILDSEYLPDDDDGYDILEKKKTTKGMDFYERQFVKLRHHGGHDAAKKMYQLWVEMNQKDRIVKPKKNFYSLIISTMAQSGLPDKAFHLFDDCINKGYEPTESMITSLFNSCGESFDPKEGLSYAHKLRDWLYERSYVLNVIQYNAMIKAFSRNGDLRFAFKILQEMASSGHKPNEATYNMLLMGAISDIESGFAHAIRITREKLKHFSLTEQTLSLFIRCTHDCKIGSLDHLSNLLQISELEKLKYEMDTKKDSITNKVIRASRFNILTIDRIGDPNDIFQVLKIPSFDEPHNRLALIGGLDGVVDLIEKYKIPISGRLQLLVLKCLPPSIDQEEKLIGYLRGARVKLTTAFFNQLIKRRSYRREPRKIIEKAINDLKSFSLQPDIVTFGSMALSCRNQSESLQLLNDLKDARITPNRVIMNTLIANACFRPYWPHLTILLKKTLQLSIALDYKTVDKIFLTMTNCEKMLLDIEQGKSDRGIRETLPQEYHDFKTFFLKNMSKFPVHKSISDKEQFDFELVPSSKSQFNKFVKKMNELRKR